MKVGAFAAATAIFVSALLVVRAAASTVGTLATAAEEGDLTIRHLRARAPVIGADDIWDNETSPELRCTMSGGGSWGCSSAPACDNVGQCTEKKMTCQERQWTVCRGCYKGAPGCPSGFTCKELSDQPSDFGHIGGGQYCNLACCYRIGEKTHTRNCPKTGCAPAPPPPNNNNNNKNNNNNNGGDACDGGCVGAIIGIVIGSLAGFCLCCILPGVFVYKHLSNGGTSMQPGPAYPETVPTAYPQQPTPAPPQAIPYAPSYPTITPIPPEPTPLKNVCIECRAALPSGARFCGKCGFTQQTSASSATGFAPPPPRV